MLLDGCGGDAKLSGNLPMRSAGKTVELEDLAATCGQRGDCPTQVVELGTGQQVMLGRPRLRAFREQFVRLGEDLLPAPLHPKVVGRQIGGHSLVRHGARGLPMITDRLTDDQRRPEGFNARTSLHAAGNLHRAP